MKCWESVFALLRRTDRHSIQAVLWKGFDHEPGASSPFIWAISRDGLIRMRSAQYPMASEMNCGVLILLETAQYCYSLDAGDLWTFTIVCNPTKRDTPAEGKRRSLTSESEINAWTQRKGTQHGFSAEHLSISNLGPVRWTSSRGHRVTHGSALISGILRITDPDLFELAMIKGIGPAKSAGMGMLLLKERLCA